MYCLGNEGQSGPGGNAEFIENPLSENLWICIFRAFGRGFLHGSMNAPYVCKGVFKRRYAAFPSAGVSCAGK